MLSTWTCLKFLCMVKSYTECIKFLKMVGLHCARAGYMLTSRYE